MPFIQIKLTDIVRSSIVVSSNTVVTGGKREIGRIEPPAGMG